MSGSGTASVADERFRPDRDRSAACSPRRSAAVPTSRSNGAGRPVRSSRARVTARGPNRRRSSSAASTARRRRGSSASKSPSCSRSPKPDAVTPMSRIFLPAHLGASELQRDPPDRLRQVRRLAERSLPRHRVEARCRGPSRSPSRPSSRPTGAARRRPPTWRGAFARARPGRRCPRRRCARGRSTSPRPGRRPGPGRRRGRGPRGRPRGSRSGGRALARSIAARSPIVATPKSRSAAAVCGPTPHRREIGSGARKAASSPGGTTTRPSGFRRSEAILATSLVAATPTDAVSSQLALDRVLDPAGDRRAVPEQGARRRDVEERLVDRDRLHERREPPEDRHHLAADALVRAAVHRHEDAVRAEPPRRPDGHRGVDPELPRLVRGRAHDPAVVRPAHPDRDRPAAQLRVVALLDRREERVEVDVEDRPGRGGGAADGGVVARSHASRRGSRP